MSLKKISPIQWVVIGIAAVAIGVMVLATHMFLYAILGVAAILGLIVAITLSAKQHDQSNPTPTVTGDVVYDSAVANARTDLTTLLSEMRARATQVIAIEVRHAVMEGIRLIPDLLDMLADKDPGSMVSAITKIRLQVLNYNIVLGSYIELQNGTKSVSPDYLQLMQRGASTLQDFPSFPQQGLARLRSDQLLEFRAALSQLEPPPFKLELPG